MSDVKRKSGNDEQQAAHRLSDELTELRARLQECEDTLAAIRAGGVDAIVVPGLDHEQVFTLAGSENAYRVFVEAMDEGALTVNAGGTVLYANKAFANLLGKPLGTVIGSSILGVIHPSNRSEFEAVFEQARASSGGRCELTLTRSNGEQIPIFVSARSCVEFGDKAICMVITDLSEQKRNEQIVADGKLARLILSQAQEAMAVCDTSGSIRHCNRAFEQLSGQNPLLHHFDEALALEILEPAQNSSTSEIGRRFSIQEAMAGREFRALEVCSRPQRGEGVHLLLTTSPLLLPNMERAGMLVTLLNIEERRRTENALRRSEKMAATGRLAASIAHEINNPLAALTNLVYLIQSEAPSGAIGKYALMAEKELARVAHITRQTLAFYRESNKPADVSLPELIDSALFLYASAIRRKRVLVTRDIRYTGNIRAYANELRQVISNLLGNAVEALPVGGTLRIRVYLSREWNNSSKTGIRVVIGDTGAGIHPEHKRHLFEPFFTTKAEKGTGLGLWVSQGIVEKHGGAIRIKSSTHPRRSGTVFSIFLPNESTEQRAAA